MNDYQRRQLRMLLLVLQRREHAPDLPEVLKSPFEQLVQAYDAMSEDQRRALAAEAHPLMEQEERES